MKTNHISRRLLSMLLALTMLLGLMPVAALAGDDITVYVTVENTKKTDASWTGKLLDRKQITVPAGSTVAAALKAAVAGTEIALTGVDSGYVSAVNGLSASGMEGWMVLVNDWFINLGVGSNTVENGDLVELVYSMTMGEDYGGSWGNNYKSLRTLTSDVGTLTPAFDAAVTSYTLTVPASASAVVLTPTATNKNFQVRASVGGTEYKRTAAIPVANGTVISVKCGDPSWPSMNSQAGGTANTVDPVEYTVTVEKAKSSLSFAVTPADAVLKLYDSKGAAVAPTSGTAWSALTTDETYSYHVSKYGYVSQRGTVKAGAESTISVTLTQADAPSVALPDYTGDWINFRGNDRNMGITAAPTPTQAAEAVLKWGVSYGTGWSAAPTPPILVNGDIYIVSAGKVIRASSEDGSVLAQSAALTSTSTFSLNPITYGGGLVYVLGTSGQVTALRADTLESVWISEKLPGTPGQTNSPITYHNGYIYTGTWNRETGVGTYFCLSTTDENPAQTNETKYCTWKLDHTGGFYWAGAYATDKYVIFGSDDGSNEGTYTETATLYSVDPVTGAVLDTVEHIKGDIRSTVAYDAGTDAVYCATKGGQLVKVRVNADGTFDDSTLKTFDLGGMSTGTPLVYDGTLFIGVSGPSQFGSTGHKLKVIKADDLSLITEIDTKGYVQTSALLSTAYAQSAGKLYIYITYNARPGGIDVLEYDIAAKTGVSSALFTPPAEMQNYCICSLVCDSDGTIYYKNDSGRVMAVEANAAWASDIRLNDSTISGFSASTAQYDVVVPRGTEHVTVSATPNSGSVALVDSVRNSKTVALTDGKATVPVVITHGSDLRTYTLNIRWASDDATLSALYGNESNTVNASKLTMTPAYSAAATSYLISGVSAGRSFVNLWLKANDGGAAVVVKAVSGVDAEEQESDGSISVTATNTSTGQKRYAVYFAAGNDTAAVDVTVTAENGTAVKTLRVVLTKKTEAAYTAAGITSFSIDGTAGVIDETAKTITVTLPAGTSLTALTPTVVFTGASVTPADGAHDFSSPVVYRVTAFDGSVKAYTVTVKTAPPAENPTEKTIRVTFRLIGCERAATDVDLSAPTALPAYVTWIPTTSYTLSRGSTVYDLFIKAMTDAGLSQQGADKNYVATIYAPSVLGGYALSEFTNGRYSGWMYTIAGKHPGYGLKEQALSDGDVVVWHYVNDYRHEVKDWFDDVNYPALGDGTYWSGWLKAADTAPAKPSAGGDTPVTPTEPQKPAAFDDVKDGSWYSEAVKYVTDKGLFNGVANGRFDPDASMTRGMLATVLYRLGGKPAAAGGRTFRDVADGQWYADAVEWAAGAGIASGYGDDLFGANDRITREQLVAMLYRFAGHMKYELTQSGTAIRAFQDYGSVSEYALPAMSWAVDCGVIKGSENKLEPAGFATRAEVAAILMRFCEAFVK